MGRDLNKVTGSIVDAAVRIHRGLGPGLLESVYLRILEYELTTQGYKVERERTYPVVWRGLRLGFGFRADLVVEDRVIVETKSVEHTLPVHKKQLLTYLRLADKRVGLLLNFGLETMKDGVHRIANQIRVNPE